MAAFIVAVSCVLQGWFRKEASRVERTSGELRSRPLSHSRDRYLNSRVKQLYGTRTDFKVDILSIFKLRMYQKPFAETE